MYALIIIDFDQKKKVDPMKNNYKKDERMRFKKSIIRSEMERWTTYFTTFGTFSFLKKSFMLLKLVFDHYYLTQFSLQESLRSLVGFTNPRKVHQKWNKNCEISRDFQDESSQGIFKHTSEILHFCLTFWKLLRDSSFCRNLPQILI